MNELTILMLIILLLELCLRKILFGHVKSNILKTKAKQPFIRWSIILAMASLIVVMFLYEGPESETALYWFWLVFFGILYGSKFIFERIYNRAAKENRLEFILMLFSTGMIYAVLLG